MRYELFYFGNSLCVEAGLNYFNRDFLVYIHASRSSPRCIMFLFCDLRQSRDSSIHPIFRTNIPSPGLLHSIKV
jgi:hypothetical protein